MSCVGMGGEGKDKPETNTCWRLLVEMSQLKTSQDPQEFSRVNCQVAFVRGNFQATTCILFAHI